MNSDVVEDVVHVHLESFPGFFLSFLGSRFLRIYYWAVSNAAESITFVYLNHAREVIGFVAGTTNPRGFYSRLLRRYWFKFTMASLPAILRRPKTINRIARAFFHPSQNPYGDDIAGLYSIAVLPKIQGTGVGQMLVLRFLKEAGRRGCSGVVLSTDRDHNDRVNRFYSNLGFTVQRQYETPEGRRMNEYWINLKA